MNSRQHKAEASDFAKAIKELASKPDNLNSFESYLSLHFAEWLKRYGNTPENIVSEFKNFAEID